jgi:predicted dienelactone hydrolase
MSWRKRVLGVLIRVMALLVMFTLVLPSPAWAQGLQQITIPADPNGREIAGAVWYPCDQPPATATTIRLGRQSVQATPDCPLTRSAMPLIVISHGSGGSMAGHHDTAEALAAAGYAVAAISHPVDTGGEQSHGDRLAWFTERPADIRRLVDFMLGAWSGRAHLDPGKIGFFGFSRGAYTGLVLIGAEPDFGALLACPPGREADCAQARQGHPPSGFVHDPRIRAAVIADPPLSPLFPPSALRGITVPVQLWASERSGDIPSLDVTAAGVAQIARNLPERPDFHPVANAGHFAFLPPCPAAMAQALPQLCTDPPGFDRAAFHKALDASVVAFFEQHIPPGT